jgi:hypothetical protein
MHRKHTDARRRAYIYKTTPSYGALYNMLT